MTRYQFIEQLLRQIYGNQPTDDSGITFNLVNQYLSQGIGVAAQKNYTDSLQMDGVSYVNNAFYTKFSDIAVTSEGNFIYKLQLPQVPVALGKNEGVASLQFKDSVSNRVSQSAIPLSTNQVGYYDNIRPIQNKIVFWSEGNFLYAKSTILLDRYTATVRMVSGGNFSDLDSVLLVPDNYIPLIVEYIKAQLAFERNQPQDTSNDGVDSK